MSRLIDPQDCLLVLIDVQPGFLAKVADLDASALLARIAFLSASARFCGIPILATVESPDRMGHLPSGLVNAAGEPRVVEKRVFGLADDPLVWPVVEAFERSTVVLVGLETDVCVAHSALGLLDRGVRVVVVEDAVASPGSAHHAGLARMRHAGAIMVCSKQLFYEWIRSVDRADAFHAEHLDLVEPPGVTL